MMVSLALVRQHLNLVDHSDDGYIEELITVAESTLQSELNINMANIPHAQLKIFEMCVCQLVAAMYQEREAAVTSAFTAKQGATIFSYLKELVHNYTINSFG
jgi:hypothetical protein